MLKLLNLILHQRDGRSDHNPHGRVSLIVHHRLQCPVQDRQLETHGFTGSRRLDDEVVRAITVRVHNRTQHTLLIVVQSMARSNERPLNLIEIVVLQKVVAVMHGLREVTGLDQEGPTLLEPRQTSPQHQQSFGELLAISVNFQNCQICAATK